MAQAKLPNLDNSPINLAAIREKSQKELVTILNNIRGDKCLVVDPNLGGSLSLIVQTSVLKQHGVIEYRHLTAEPIQTNCTKVVYLVRTQLEFMKFISTHVRNDLSNGLHRDYFVYFVPRRSLACEKILEEEKVHKLLTIGEYPLYVIPLDTDVVSFELDRAYREFAVDGDTSSLWHVAKAIHSMGLIPNVTPKGTASTRVADILKRLQLEELEQVKRSEKTNTSLAVPEINALVLIDRDEDMVTPMCTQLTYEGLIDEILRVNNCVVEVDSSVMEVQQEGTVKIQLNSSERLFKETRDLNFGAACEILHRKSKAMKKDYATRQTDTISELKDFAKKMTPYPELSRHVNLAEHVLALASTVSFRKKLDMEQTIVVNESKSRDKCIEYVEELMYRKKPLVSVLRILVLFSVTNGGLPEAEFDHLRRELLHCYGFEHAAALKNLEKAGLFRKREPPEKSISWAALKRALGLEVGGDDGDHGGDDDGLDDVTYVSSGRAPLGVCLVQQAIRSGWQSVEESVKLVRGRRPRVLVVFVGGVTFAEIAALRFLSCREGMEYDLIVGTTKIVNGTTLIESFL